MCGIAASLNLQPADHPRELQSLLSRMAHRGEPHLQREHAALGDGSIGCNRLAITSTSERVFGQPLKSEDGRVTLVYNGQIFNFRRLAAALRLPREAIELYGDGKVVAELLAQQGPAAIASMDGMFSLIWHDSRSSCYYVARDRFGIKPLYVAASPHRVLLASELKALVPQAGVQRIAEIPPGETWEVRRAQDAWCLSTIGRKRIEVDPQDAPIHSEELAEALRQVVTEMLDTRESVGIYLSGGVDSGGIFAIAASVRPSITPLILGGSNALDAPFALRLARRFGCAPVTADVLDEEALYRSVEKTIAIVESFEPNVVRQSAVQYHICRLAERAGLKVVLCGEGADELFCGYPEFLSNTEQWSALRLRFLKDLYRTQLQRVDRMSMHFTTEVRVPYLRDQVANIALRCNVASSFVTREGRRPVVKVGLRAALRPWLSPPWVDREKVVLSEGVGLGSNDLQTGLFSRIARRVAGPGTLEQTREEFPGWSISTPEEALYLSIFHRLGYTKLESAKERVMANSMSSVRAIGG